MIWADINELNSRVDGSADSPHQYYLHHGLF